MNHHIVDTERLPTRAVLAISHRQPGVRDTDDHRHVQGQLIGCRAGLLTVTTARKWFVVPSTHAVWIPPNQDHAVRSHGPFDGWTLYVAHDRCASLPVRATALAIGPLLRAATERAENWGTEPRTIEEHRIADVILDEIANAPATMPGAPVPRDPRLRRLAQAILDDPTDRRSHNQWAQWAALSPRTLSRRFSIETGYSFAGWRQRVRAFYAVDLLARGHAVTAIAIDLGYDNVGAFIAMFRRTFGTTPGCYRRRGLPIPVDDRPKDKAG